MSCVWSYHFSAKIPIHSIRIMLTLPFFFPSHFFFLCSYKSLVSGLRKPSFVNGPIRWHITDQLDIHPVLKYICDLEAPTRVVLTIHTWYYIKLIALTRNIVLLHIINRLGVHIILLSE